MLSSFFFLAAVAAAPARHSEFCRVCRRAIERVIDLYARPAP
jgi:hypothetical protein